MTNFNEENNFFVDLFIDLKSHCHLRHKTITFDRTEIVVKTNNDNRRLSKSEI